MRVKALLLLSALFFSGQVFAQKVVPYSGPPIELTETDIARLEDFDGRYATVFRSGPRVNVTKDREIVRRQKSLALETDPMSSRRLYLYDASGDSGKVLLGYLKWLPKDSGLNQIVLYQAISP